MKELVKVMKKLRSPEGCPWDKKQTFESLLSCMLEEVHEIIDATLRKRYDKIEEELGDFLCIAAMVMAIGEERGVFSQKSVVRSAVNKMIHRHPHVFGKEKARTAEKAFRLWNAAKSQEKNAREMKSLLDDLTEVFPALHRADKIQRRVSRVGFDWPTLKGVIDKIDEELRELKHEVQKKNKNKARVQEELGDLLFSVVNLGRKLHINAEIALLKTNQKFIRRFKKLEEVVRAQGKDLESMTLREMDAVWNQVKKKK